ncbi:MAG: preprotein translocase subunit SecE [Deltaproteobacteria bacterium]|nr:preprotein translocase subunit SecE [Deltaproteobacteria bacterium]
MGLFKSIQNFFRDVQGELKRVTWPTWEETRNFTGVVVTVALALAMFLGSADMGLSWVVKQVIR